MPQLPDLKMCTRSQPSGPKYLIRLSLPEADWDDAWELCRGIEQCGGHRTEEGFAFCSAEECSLALEILQERFGRQYFQRCEAPLRGDTLRLLVALPEQERRHLLCGYLARQGFRVAEAEHGLACLESLRRQPPQILVLHRDLLWGGWDGVLACMRQDRCWSQIPVVLLTRQCPPDEAVGRPPSLIVCLEESVSLPVLLASIRQLVPRTA